MDFMDFSRRLYRWASEGVDMYVMVSDERSTYTGGLKFSYVPGYDLCKHYLGYNAAELIL